MQPTLHRVAPLFVVVASILFAAPLGAQQTVGPRRPAQASQQQSPQKRTPPQVQRQAPAGAPVRTAQQAPAQRMPTPAPNGAKAGQYPVRQAGANQVPPAAGPPAQPGGKPQTVIGPIAPQAPFQLAPQQQALVDQILINWEKQSDSIGTYTCKFGRWEVNETFGPAEHHFVLSEAHGEIKFKSPGYGSYYITDQTEWDKGKNAYTARTEALDHWVCDGKSIFEYNHEKKQLIERQLAPELQGKAITDGPLPFVFGTKADQLKRRYWMKDITPSELVNKEIWLEAWPKFQRDSANFQHAIIVLNQSDYMPSALRIVLPDGKNKQDYKFDNTKVNNPLVNLTTFFAPRPPLGWTKVVIPAGGTEAVPPPGAVPAQAQQPGAAVQRN